MKYSLMLAAAVLFAAGCEKQQKKVEEKVTRVEIATLQKRVFQQRIPLQGTVEPVEHAVISAKISGTLETLNVDEGDKIKKGEELFTIDRQILKNQVTVKENEIKVREAALESAGSSLEVAKINKDVAKNNLDVAKINLNVAKNDLNIAKINFQQAERDFKRADNLKKTDAISNSSWESADTDFKKAEMAVKSAEADFRKAEVAVKSAEAEVRNAEAEFKNAQAAVQNADAQLKQAQINLEIAKKNLEDSKVCAPFDCVVTSKLVERNEFVSVGQEILKLENQSSLEVSCFLSAVYYDQLIPGKTMAEFPDYKDKDGKILRAPITYKAPAIDPESRTFKIKIKIADPAAYSPAMVSGMLCELNIILVEREGYGLPESAVLLRAENRMIAFTMDKENRAQSVEIKRGIVDRGYAEILNGSEYLEHRFVITGQNFINNNSLLKEIDRERE